LKVADHRYLEEVSLKVRIDSRVSMISSQNQDMIVRITTKGNKITLRFLMM